MLERQKPILISTAIASILDKAKHGSTEQIAFEETIGRFLTEPISAVHDVPLFDRSPYDGFAFRSADSKHATRGNSIKLEVIGEVRNGHVFRQKVCRQQAVRIMTGGAIPEGADAVVKLESVTESAQHDTTWIELKRSYDKGDNISFQGEDIGKGTMLIDAGTHVTPGVIALLATFGYTHVDVSKKPLIGIIATGSELLAVDDALEPGNIRNSNSAMVAAQVKRAGGEPIYLGQFNDDFEVCYEHIKTSLDKVDFLVTTGGVSVGDYDYMPIIYQALGANVLFNKVNMRPGSVTTVAEKNGKLLFGLSGNPSACFVGFELFVRPAIRKFLHAKHVHLRKEKAFLGADFLKPNPFDRLVRGYLSFQNGKLIATPSGLDKSNVVSSLANANVLILFPQGTRGFQTGMTVDILLLDDQEGSPRLEDTELEEAVTVE